MQEGSPDATSVHRQAKMPVWIPSHSLTNSQLQALEQNSKKMFRSMLAVIGSQWQLLEALPAERNKILQERAARRFQLTQSTMSKLTHVPYRVYDISIYGLEAFKDEDGDMVLEAWVKEHDGKNIDAFVIGFFKARSEESKRQLADISLPAFLTVSGVYRGEVSFDPNEPMSIESGYDNQPVYRVHPFWKWILQFDLYEIRDILAENRELLRRLDRKRGERPTEKE